LASAFEFSGLRCRASGRHTGVSMRRDFRFLQTRNPKPETRKLGPEARTAQKHRRWAAVRPLSRRHQPSQPSPTPCSHEPGPSCSQTRHPPPGHRCMHPILALLQALQTHEPCRRGSGRSGARASRGCRPDRRRSCARGGRCLSMYDMCVCVCVSVCLEHNVVCVSLSECVFGCCLRVEAHDWRQRSQGLGSSAMRAAFRFPRVIGRVPANLRMA
jgi:hypothetical protein